MIRDDGSTLMWAKDAHILQTVFNHPNGLIDWEHSMDWVDQLDYAGYDDWRLPNAFNFDGTYPTTGFNQAETELGYLYYTELGNTSDGGLINTGPFENIIYENKTKRMWTNYAWSYINSYGILEVHPYFFDFGNGYSNYGGAGWHAHVWVVRDAVAPVPEPSTILLLFTSLVAFIGLRRKIQYNL